MIVVKTAKFSAIRSENRTLWTIQNNELQKLIITATTDELAELLDKMVASVPGGNEA